MKPPCRLEAVHDIRAFDCGDQLLNNFLKQSAWQSRLSKSTFTYVIVEENRVIAYYSLAVGSVMHEEVLAPIVSSAPGKKSITILRISRLAVDRTKQKQQLGRHMLKDALSRACTIAQNTGIRCIVVDAKNARAEKFYRQYNFEPWPIDGFCLYLLMKDVRKSFA